MSELTLIIGNYNYSAWSLCAWSFLRKSGLAFDTVRVPGVLAGATAPQTHIRLVG